MSASTLSIRAIHERQIRTDGKTTATCKKCGGTLSTDDADLALYFSAYGCNSCRIDDDTPPPAGEEMASEPNAPRLRKNRSGATPPGAAQPAIADERETPTEEAAAVPVEEPKKRSRKPRAVQQELPTMETPHLQPVDDAAERYREVRNERQELTKQEKKAKDYLLELMEKHELFVYKYAEPEEGKEFVVRRTAKQNVTVRTEKSDEKAQEEGEKEEPEEDGDGDE